MEVCSQVTQAINNKLLGSKGNALDTGYTPHSSTKIFIFQIFILEEMTKFIRSRIHIDFYLLEFFCISSSSFLFRALYKLILIK